MDDGRKTIASGNERSEWLMQTSVGYWVKRRFLPGSGENVSIAKDYDVEFSRTFDLLIDSFFSSKRCDIFASILTGAHAFTGADGI